MRRALALVAALDLLRVGGARDDPPACTSRMPELREVKFAGNKRFTDHDLKKTIASTPTSWVRRIFRVIGTRQCLDRDEVTRDVARLLLYYRRHGHPRVVVEPIIDTRPAHGARLRFKIQEGEAIRVDTLAIVGEPPGTAVDTGGKLPDAIDAVRRGHPLGTDALDSAALALRRRLQNRGYHSAAVVAETRIDTAAYRAQVTLRATPGPPVHVGTIHVTVAPYPKHDQRVSDNALRRMTGLTTGALLRSRDLETAQRNLAASDVYGQVAVRVDSVREQNGRAVADVIVTAAEAYANDVQVGAGWATLDCLRVQTTWRRSAFLKPRGELQATARLSKIGVGAPLDFAPSLCSPSAQDDPFSAYLNYHVGLTYSNPGVGARPVRRSVSLYTERRSEYLAFLRTTYIGTALSRSRPFADPRWVSTLAYTLTYGNTVAEPAVLCSVFSACLPADRATLAETRPLGVFSVMATRDGTGAAANPTRGTIFRAEVRGSSRYLLSDPRWSFIGARLDGSYYKGLGKNLIGAARVRLATVWPVSPDGSEGEIPIEERLYAGGASTVRGFAQNALGPQVFLADTFATTVVHGDTLFQSDPKTTGATTSPSGGNELLVASVELRARSPAFPTLLQFVGFVDAGVLRNRGSSNEGGTSIRYTPGVGLRMFTPIGAARLDVGYNKYAPPAGPAYYDVPLGYESAPLYCVSPGNTLPVTGFGQTNASGQPIPPVQAEGPCLPTFARPRPDSFFRRLTLHFSFGQAF